LHHESDSQGNLDGDALLAEANGLMVRLLPGQPYSRDR
jgi:hypothetical protein